MGNSQRLPAIVKDCWGTASDSHMLTHMLAPPTGTDGGRPAGAVRQLCLLPNVRTLITTLPTRTHPAHRRRHRPSRVSGTAAHGNQAPHRARAAGTSAVRDPLSHTLDCQGLRRHATCTRPSACMSCTHPRRTHVPVIDGSPLPLLCRTAEHAALPPRFRPHALPDIQRPPLPAGLLAGPLRAAPTEGDARAHRVFHRHRV